MRCQWLSSPLNLCCARVFYSPNLVTCLSSAKNAVVSGNTSRNSDFRFQSLFSNGLVRQGATPSEAWLVCFVRSKYYIFSDLEILLLIVSDII